MTARALREYKPGDCGSITNALSWLKDARAMLRTAGASKSADYVARAIKSTEGALRHADRCRVERDQKLARHPNGAPMFAADGTMLDEKGNRSIFDDVDE